MRLAVDGRFLLQDVTGVQRVAVEFVHALDRLLAAGDYPRLAVDLLMPARGAPVTAPDFARIRVRRGGQLTGHAWEQLELPRLAGSDPLLCLGNLAPARRLLHRRTGVYTMVHDLSYRYFPDAYSRRFRMAYSAIVPVVLSRSDRVFTVSESERRSIGRHYPGLGPARLVAVQNGGGEGAAEAMPSDHPAALGVGARSVPSRRLRGDRYLYVGSLTRRKNAEGLLAAAIRLVEEDGATFTFVGSTNASFESLGLRVPTELSARLRFRGQVNDPAAIEREYRRAAVFVFPSFYEASPLPPIEAMRFGCPVVAADIPSLRERCGDAAAYCDPHDRDAIVARVRELSIDPARWAEHQLRGLRQAARFSWAAQVRTVLRHILPSTD